MNKFIILLSVLFIGCGHIKKQSTLNRPIDFYSNIRSNSDEIKASRKLKKRVDHWINVFKVDFKNGFQQYLRNSEKYKSLVLSILREHHLPDELFYLPIIESGYNLNARSHASAVGPCSL